MCARAFLRLQAGGLLVYDTAESCVELLLFFEISDMDRVVGC